MGEAFETKAQNYVDGVEPDGMEGVEYLGLLRMEIL
jgi:hypothetical protein